MKTSKSLSPAVQVFIQNEKGNPVRHRYNEVTLEYLGSMELCCAPPQYYGFIPGTVGDDGDCIDFWMITGGEFSSGETVECRVLGLMEMFENTEHDFKVIGCPIDEDIELTDEIFAEIRDFTLKVFSMFPEVKVKVGNLLPAEKALEFISKGGD